MSDAASLAFRILARVASGSSDAAEIAGAVGTETARVRAALDAMCESGALRRVGDRLEVGAPVADLLRDLAGLRDLAQQAFTVLADLTARSGCDAAVCVRDGDGLRNIAEVTAESGPEGIPWSAVTRPLTSCAGGLAVLAATGDEPAGDDATARDAYLQALREGWCRFDGDGGRTIAAIVRGVAVPMAVEVRERPGSHARGDEASLAAMVREAAGALGRG